MKNRYLHIRWKEMANGVAIAEISTEKKQKSSEKILVMISENASITTEQMAARLGIKKLRK